MEKVSGKLEFGGKITLTIDWSKFDEKTRYLTFVKGFADMVDLWSKKPEYSDGEFISEYGFVRRITNLSNNNGEGWQYRKLVYPRVFKRPKKKDKKKYKIIPCD